MSGRVTRRGQVGKCSCKVGACRICGSSCKRCKCSCDGVNPIDALARHKGAQSKKAKRKNVEPTKQMPSRKSKRCNAASGCVDASQGSNDDDDSTYVEKNDNESDDSLEVTSHMSHSMKSLSRMQKAHNKENEKSQVKRRQTNNSTKAGIVVDESKETDNEDINDDQSSYEESTHNHKRRGTDGGAVSAGPLYILEKRSKLGQDFPLNNLEDDSVLNKSKKVAKSSSPRTKNDNLDEVLSTKSHTSLFSIAPNASIETSSNTNTNSAGNASVGSFIVPQIPDMPIEIRGTMEHSPKNLNKEQVSSIIDYFSMPKHLKHNIPSYDSRTTSSTLNTDDKVRFRRLVNMIKDIINKLSITLIPGPSKDLVLTEVLSTMLDDINLHRQNNDNNITKKDTTNNKKKTTNRRDISSNVKDREKFEKLTTSLCLAQRYLKRQSIERRTCRAVLYAGVSNKDLVDLLSKHEFTFARGKPQTLAREDFNRLCNGDNLIRTERSFSQHDTTAIHKAVEFLLSEDCVVPLSYGHRDVQLTNKEVYSLPNLQRKLPRKDIVKDYYNYTENDPKQIKKSTLHKLLNLITAYDQSVLSSVDYVSTILVDSTSERLQAIIDTCLSHEKDKHTTVTNLVTKASHFLKHKYANHVEQNNDTICFHGLEYGLSKGSSHGTDVRHNSNCSACKFPFRMLQMLEGFVKLPETPVDDDVKLNASKVIGDTRHKYKLFMGHVCRLRSQTRAIEAILDELSKQCIQSKGSFVRGVMIMDFKMKFEVLSSRESSLEHFGKRGIGWHGCALVYYLYEVIDDDGNYGPKEYRVYIDQILEGSNRQDGAAVLGLLEAALTSITTELPFVEEIILQSDNAKSYQNHFLTIGIHLLNIQFRNRIFVCQYVHTETQGGKTIVDSHFGNCRRKLDMYMKEKKSNIVTRISSPKGLAMALAYKGGLKISIVQLVELDLDRLEYTQKKLDHVKDKMNCYFSRINHIYFEPPVKDIGDDERELKIELYFSARAYSSVGKAVRFHVNIPKKTVIPDPIASSLIEKELSGKDTSPNQAQKIAKKIAEDINNALNDFVHDDDNDTTIESMNIEDIHLENVVNDYYIKKRMHTSRRLRSTMKKTKFDLVDKDSSDISISDESLSTNSDNYHSSDDSDFDIDDDYTNETESINDDKPSGVEEQNTRLYKSTEDDPVYDSSNMFTCTQVVKHMELGIPLPIMTTGKRSKNQRIVLNNQVSFRNDTIAKAIRHAHLIICSNKHFRDDDPLYSLGEAYNLSPDEYFKPGWARRPPHGTMYGNSYIDTYKDDLTEIFDIGTKQTNLKMAPGKMHDLLVSKYPCRFDIPSETEIKTFINLMFQNAKYEEKKRKKKANSNNDGTTTNEESRGRRKGDVVRHEWVSILETVVEADKKGKPTDLYNKLMEVIGPDPKSWPIDLPLN